MSQSYYPALILGSNLTLPHSHLYTQGTKDRDSYLNENSSAIDESR